MFNQVTLVGRLTADPELRYTDGGKAYCNFTLAVDREYKGPDGQKIADFFPVICWNKLAENCANYLHKGSLALVSGCLQNRSYLDSKGNKRQITEVAVARCKFLSPSARAQGGPRDEDAPPVGQEIGGEEELPF